MQRQGLSRAPAAEFAFECCSSPVEVFSGKLLESTERIAAESEHERGLVAAKSLEESP